MKVSINYTVAFAAMAICACKGSLSLNHRNRNDTVNTEPATESDIETTSSEIEDEQQLNKERAKDSKVVDIEPSTVSDLVPPEIGDPFISINRVEVDQQSIQVFWHSATDDRSPGNKLRYAIYYGETANLKTIDDVAQNSLGHVEVIGSDVTSYTFDDSVIEAGKEYFFNIIVSDESGNSSIYEQRGAFCGGDGSDQDPYQVCDPGSLQNIVLYRNNHYIITGDIDLVGTKDWNEGYGWKPIGDGVGFSGKLDGQGHKIRNLYIDRPAVTNVGLFAQVGSLAELKNINLTDVYLVGGSRVGGLVGNVQSHAQVTNVHVSGRVRGSQYIGGLVGNSGSLNVVNSSAEGEVRGSSSHVGGLVGSLGTNSSIVASFATGAIMGNENVGGLVGSGYSPISDSYATGPVYASGYRAGGLIGYGFFDLSVTRSYAAGNVFVANGGGGGLIGFTSMTAMSVSQSFSIGNVVVESGDVGGVIGTKDSNTTLDNVFFLDHPYNPSTCFAGGSADCSALTRPNWFLQPENYGSGAAKLDWDFSATGEWIFPQSGGLPVLRWQKPNEPISFPPEMRSGRKIGMSDMATYAIWGYCSEPDAEIHFSGPGAPAPGACEGGMWSSMWDFSGESEGDVVISVRQGESEPVTRTFVKDTVACTAVNIETQPTGASSIQQRFDQGPGPHVICNVEQMAQLQAETGNWSKSFILGNNIDLSTGYPNATIGNGVLAFTGSFDGNGFVLSRLTLDLPSDHVGLFGTFDKPGGVLRSLGLEFVDIKGEAFTGALLGGKMFHELAIIDSYATGAVRGTNHVGGLVGKIRGDLEESFARVEVIGDGKRVGGLLGAIDSNLVDVKRSFALGGVRGDSEVGGLVGYSRRVYESFATGAVSGSITTTLAEQGVGGLVGRNGEIYNSMATGSVYGRENVGGLVGFTARTSYQVFATGKVSGIEAVGGLVGSYENSMGQFVGPSFTTGEISVFSLDGHGGNLVGLTNLNTFINTYPNYYFLPPNSTGRCTGNDLDASVECEAITGMEQLLDPERLPLSVWDLQYAWQLDEPFLLPSLRGVTSWWR